MMAVGCDSNFGPDPLAAFREKGTGESESFEFLNPTSLEVLEGIYDVKSTMLTEFAAGLRDKFGEVPEIAAYSETIRNTEFAAKKAWKETLDELKAAKKDGAIVCEYALMGPMDREVGLMAIKDGQVIKKIVLSATTLKR